ncbi:hypothetical protein ARMSODRAFT_974612 [Armillaria solidipes]|uniref:Uncharacterized protein n=1 Tax=Armillaria solidipes TaxID=1076256 RepID=A0A2H3BT23_9AGAR|nr:hypothetical protein ARMSODRAFT_974612 [Armillaria solidipes]
MPFLSNSYPTQIEAVEAGLAVGPGFLDMGNITATPLGPWLELPTRILTRSEDRRTSDGKNFVDLSKEGDLKTVVPSFGGFLKKSYSPDYCWLMAFPTVEGLHELGFGDIEREGVFLHRVEDPSSSVKPSAKVPWEARKALENPGPEQERRLSRLPLLIPLPRPFARSDGARRIVLRRPKMVEDSTVLQYFRPGSSVNLTPKFFRTTKASSISLEYSVGKYKRFDCS